jgi:hypothetical protein
MAEEISVEEYTEGVNIDHQIDMTYGTRNGAYNLQPRKIRDNSHSSSIFRESCMTKCSINKGLDSFRQNEIKAVQVELRQLHDQDVIKPVKWDSISENDQNNALPYLIFLKQKRRGQIKGRGCVDDQRQKIYSQKEDFSSPNVMIESVMLTCVIDAFEGRDVATVDIPRSFLQTETDKQ